MLNSKRESLTRLSIPEGAYMSLAMRGENIRALPPFSLGPPGSEEMFDDSCDRVPPPLPRLVPAEIIHTITTMSKNGEWIELEDYLSRDARRLEYVHSSLIISIRSHRDGLSRSLQMWSPFEDGVKHRDLLGNVERCIAALESAQRRYEEKLQKEKQAAQEEERRKKESERKMAEEERKARAEKESAERERQRRVEEENRAREEKEAAERERQRKIEEERKRKSEEENRFRAAVEAETARYLREQETVKARAVAEAEKSRENELQQERIKLEAEKLKLKKAQDEILRNNRSALTQVDYSQLSSKEVIGKGSFGTVYKAEWNGISVAFKEFNISVDDLDSRDLIREAAMMANLRHPNVVQFYGVCTRPHYGIIMEYAENKSLTEVLKNYDLTWGRRLNIAKQIAIGLRYLHDQRPMIIHRDLKSMNIVIDAQWMAKLTDFGSAQVVSTLSTKTNAQNAAGTVAWMAPELFITNKHTPETDIFSLAVVFWEIASKKLPHAGLMAGIIIGRTMHGIREEIPPKCDIGLSRIITRAWNQDPKQRMNLDEIVTTLENNGSYMSLS